MSTPAETEGEEVGRLHGHRVPPPRRRRMTVADVGATKGGLHVDCPVCGERIAVDARGARVSLVHRTDKMVLRRAGRRAREWFKEAWGWSTLRGEEKTRPKLHTRSVERVFMTGAGHMLRTCWRQAIKMGYKCWFAIAWHKVDSFGQNLFVCPVEQLPRVLRGICDDSPDFARRLRQIADGALERRGVLAADVQPAADRDDDAGLLLDRLTARRVP